MNTQIKNELSLKYNLHPLILQLNSQLISAHPYNSLKFIKNWVNQKINEDNEADSSQEDGEIMILNPKKKMEFRQIKRRKAICTLQLQNFKYEKQIAKNQVAKSLIMISLKNNIFLKHLNWQDINGLLQISQLVQFSQESVIQKQNQTIKSFFILIEGQVSQINRKKEKSKMFYQGDSFCHQSFINQSTSKYSYICQTNCLICILSGKQIQNVSKSKAKQTNQFYEKSIMGINQFTYLDNQQIYKLASMFKNTKYMSAGQVVINKGEQNIKKLFLVVEGQFSKCKKNMSGQLIVFKIMKKGDFFGLQWLSNDFQTQFSVISMQEDSMLAIIEKQNLQKGIGSYERIVKRTKHNNSF